MKEIKLVILGFGNIGRGFAGVLLEKDSFIQKKYGIKLNVVAICEKNGSLINGKGLDLKKALSVELAKNPDWTSRKSLEVIKSAGADIAVELTPGDMKSGEPGLSHIMKSIECGMDVATSNKSPIAMSFKKIMEYAKSMGCEVRYEATVGGAIPLINLYRNTLQANEVKNIYGILNGTTNFILSKMSEESVDFKIALKEAQELGIAETDYSYDVDGIDTAVKVVILANAIMGKDISFKDIKIAGIREINSETIELAKKHGSEIKLIGDVNAEEVSPRLIPEKHPLNISGALNAILLETDVAGDIVITGVGAGPRETSSSILSDVIDLSQRRRV